MADCAAPAADADLADRARRILTANRRLRSALGGGQGVPAPFDLLLFLLAEEPAGGVTTSRCCAAVDVPRSTALRWIGTLVASGAIDQRSDALDGRVTLLRLTPAARDALEAWIADIAD